MESTIHKVDPNGDTLLILKNPNAPFAAGDETVWPNVLPKYRTEKMRRNERELIDLAQVEQPEGDGSREVYFQLSSKHLAFVSEYFRGLMANNWKEANSSRDFAYSVTAEDWDEAALLMVMNIIHSRPEEIPQKIGPEMVAKVAVIVDYYQCSSAFGFYAKTWMKNFDKDTSSDTYGRALLLKLFISCVFSNEIDFWKSTRIIIQESRGPIHTLGLPFPQDIVGELQFSSLEASA
ncbi:hypothetical protein ACQKWADRAFT_293877 [Trichoderma austrokoningii]